MNTPISDFVLNYSNKNPGRLHMPGHKGVDFLGIEKYDITEIDGADVLYDAKGIIAESEKNASELFSSYRTFFSTEGSSLCIKAMLAMISSMRKDKSRKATVLAARNVHKAFIYGCAISDIEVEWLYSENSSHLCSCVISAESLQKRIEGMPFKPDAVYITSPDYLGQLTDVKALSQICDKYDIPLLVDNAHGAYLAFTANSRHPINNGAFMCCDSAHKTLPVLTGGAYLHLSAKAEKYADISESFMAMMGSTSPSYLILQSLDICNKYLSEGYKTKLAETTERINKLKAELTDKGVVVCDSEPLKLVVDFKKSRINSADAVSILREHKIEPEFYDKDFLVAMFTCENAEEDYRRFSEAFLLVSLRNNTSEDKMTFKAVYGQKMTSIREAVFSPKETVAVADSEGRICACPSVSCPPAVPIVSVGERITAEAVEQMLYYGIETVEVII